MTLRWRLGISLVLAGTVACKSRSGASSRAPEPPEAAVQPLSMALVGAGPGAVVSADIFDRVFDTPTVSAAGRQLFERLSQEPSLSPRYEQFLQGLLGQPVLLATLAKMAENAPPGSSVDDLSEVVMVRLAAGLEGPAFDAALDASLDRLLAQPSVDAAFERMAAALVDRSQLTARVSALMLEWQLDLEVAVGVPMSHADFPERLEAHVEQGGRGEAMRELLGQRMLLRPKTLDSMAALIGDDAFFVACTGLVRGLLDSPDLQERTTLVFVAMIEQADATQLGRRVDDVLVTSEVEQAVARWADEVTASAALTDFAVTLGEALDDPNLQAELYDVLIGASGSRTALARVERG